MKNRKINITIIAGGIAIIALLTLWQQYSRRNFLIVYCAHDSVYSEKIIKEFEKESGIRVIPKFDTEATKSLGLTELIKREKNNPRCDLFWNNEVLGTMELKRNGLLLPYKGSGYARIPEKFKDPDGCWTGFSARLRVYIINKKKLTVTYEAVHSVLTSDLSGMSIAKPLYGTTLTHYCCLWREKGEAELKRQDTQWRARGVKILNGNAAVKNVVAIGGCDLGWTDTDDFFMAYDRGAKVGMLPIRLKNGDTICIPNTVSIIKGTTQRKTRVEIGGGDADIRRPRRQGALG